MAHTAPALAPFGLLLEGLAPDPRVFYRVRHRAAGSGAPFAAGDEGSFHARRAPGSGFTFCIQGDSRPERASQFDGELYDRVLAAVAADRPDPFAV